MEEQTLQHDLPIACATLLDPELEQRDDYVDLSDDWDRALREETDIDRALPPEWPDELPFDPTHDHPGGGNV